MLKISNLAAGVVRSDLAKAITTVLLSLTGPEITRTG